MTAITNLNYLTTLKQSTNPRGSSPNGNWYWDPTTDQVQLIGVDELPTVNFGSGAVTNPLNNTDGVTMRALYNFENYVRRTNETLRHFKRGIAGNYRFAGAYNWVNGVKLNGTDRNKIRGSGFIEYAASNGGNTDVDRIYHGIRSLNPIQPGSVPYYAAVSATDELSLQSATWVNFVRTGPIDEVIQMFGSTAHGDTGAGNFDYTAKTLVARVRSWGYFPGETTSISAGVTEFSGNSAGYGIGETLNTANTYSLANVYGGAAIAPFSGMSLVKNATPATVSGFNEGNGTFTWTLNNTLGGTVQQCAAYLDAITLINGDIDAGAGTYNGHKGRVWYSYNPAGLLVTASIGGAGLNIAGLAAAEKQKLIQTDDTGATKTSPYYPGISINVGPAAIADPNAWYTVQYVDGAGSLDFNTLNAVIVNDASGQPMKGPVSAVVSGQVINTSYDYDNNTQAGLAAGVDKNIVVLVEGDGIAAQAITYATIQRIPTVAITCAPIYDTNV